MSLNWFEFSEKAYGAIGKVLWGRSGGIFLAYGGAIDGTLRGWGGAALGWIHLHMESSPSVLSECFDEINLIAGTVTVGSSYRC